MKLYLRRTLVRSDQLSSKLPVFLRYRRDITVEESGACLPIGRLRGAPAWQARCFIAF